MSAPGHAAEFSVIIPCFNERDNVARLVERLDLALAGIAWEAVFVDDDSPDGTADAARAIAAENPRVRCIRRVGRFGLASAVIEGALSCSAPVLAVMDGDLQHDETKLPALRAAVLEGADLAVASRFAPGGDAAGLANPWRQRLTALGTNLAGAATAARLSDPMSGFFAIRRPLFETLAPRLTGQGFKILLDLLLSSPTPLAVREIGAKFRPREAGQSKLSLAIILQFGGLLLDKATGGRLPLRFVAFAAVGIAGLALHYAVLTGAHGAGLRFGAAQALATLVAMVCNFQLNNRITYPEYRLRGRALWVGLALFMAVCGIGAVANIGIARMLYHDRSGWSAAGLAGAAIGLVWNYTVSSTLVWRPRRRA